MRTLFHVYRPTEPAGRYQLRPESSIRVPEARIAVSGRRSNALKDRDLCQGGLRPGVHTKTRQNAAEVLFDALPLESLGERSPPCLEGRDVAARGEPSGPCGGKYWTRHP